MNECTISPRVLLFSVGKGVTTSQPPRRRHVRPRSSVITRKMARRLDRLAEHASNPESADWYRRFAERMERCATNQDGWRCGAVLCPRCSRRTAIRYRKRVENLLDEPNAAAMVTLTVGTDELGAGLRTLKQAYAALRRRSAWKRTVCRGIAGIEAKPGEEHADLWNVHLHAVVLLWAPASDGSAWLGDLWTTVLEKFRVYGSAHWLPIVQRCVPPRSRRTHA